MAFQKLFNRFNYIKNHQGFQKYFHNTKWLFIAQFSRLIAGFLVGVWVARYFGPTKFGIFSYVLAFTSLFAGIAKLGLDGIIVRDLVNEPEKRNIYLGTAFWLKIIGALLVLGLIAIAVQFTSNDAITNLYIFIIASGLIFQSFEVIDFYFQSKVLSKFVSLSQMAQIFLSSLLKVFFILTHAGLIWFVIVSGFDQITLAASLLFAYKYQKLPNFFRYFDLGTAKKLLMSSWPLILGGIAIMVQARIDQIMINEMIGPKELGYFAAAMKFIEIFGFIPMIISLSIAPAITNAKKKSYSKYLQRLQNYYSLMFLLFIIIAIPILFAGKYFVLLVFGDKFAYAGTLFSLMAFRLFFTNMGVAKHQYILNEGLFYLSFISAFIGAFVNIAFNYIFIPLYGAKGAILVSYISFFVTLFIFELFYKKTRLNIVIMFKGIIFSYNIFNKKSWRV